jgi:hypothetical protein
MSNTLKNLLIVLALLTVGYGAYYLYSARTSTTGQSVTDVEFQAMLTRTQAFIDRRQELDRMQVDVSIFADERFQNLEANNEPLTEVDAGRANPFAAVSGN